MELVSVNSAGEFGFSSSFEPTISDDGRYVAFRSLASNLVPNDTNALLDIFVRDRQLGTTQLVSVGIDGPSNGSSFAPVLSGDGQSIIFRSSATNLISNDDNQSSDLYLRDLVNGVTTRINSNSGIPNLASEDTLGGDISANGRYVVFESLSDDIVANDNNQLSDIFVLDRQSMLVERVSTSVTGIEANGQSENRAISDDGRFVVFDSRATNLTEDLGATGFNIFIKDRLTGDTRLISRNHNGGAANESRRRR